MAKASDDMLNAVVRTLQTLSKNKYLLFHDGKLLAEMIDLPCEALQHIPIGAYILGIRSQRWYEVTKNENGDHTDIYIESHLVPAVYRTLLLIL
jgi:hypothetical protein